jgi:hypothetical protein
MSTINVLFEIPESIQRGLAEGTMRLFGGAVRNLKGEFVAHLSPGKLLNDRLQSGIPFDPSALASAIGNVQSAALLASGIGAVNLALNTAGFAVMRQKLNAIIDQLDQALVALDDLKEDVEWLKSKQQSELRGEIDSACDLAGRAIRLQDQDLFKEARTSAHKARRRIFHVLREILKRRRVISRRQEFAELAGACVILASVEASCDEPIEGPAQAATHLTATAHEMAETVAQFEQQCRDYGIDTAARIRLGPGGAKELGAIMAELRKSITAGSKETMQALDRNCGER